MRSIFSFFYETFFEDSSFFGKLLGFVCAVLLVIVIVILMYLVYLLIDQSGSKVCQDKGIVYYGEFVPEHTTTTFVSTGKVTVPVIIRHYDTWYLDVSVTDGSARVAVAEDFYNSTNINDSVMIEYTHGVLTKGNLYIKYIEKLKK